MQRRFHRNACFHKCALLRFYVHLCALEEQETLPNLEYFVVDVFTTAPLAGNPLAVVMNTCGLTTERMQAIAREFNLSETTFVERRPAEVERAEGVRVRIFTTQEELSLPAIQRWARRAC